MFKGGYCSKVAGTDKETDLGLAGADGNVGGEFDAGDVSHQPGFVAGGKHGFAALNFDDVLAFFLLGHLTGTQHEEAEGCLV